MFKEELTQILCNPFHTVEEEERLLNLFYEAIITLIPEPDKDKKTTDQYTS